MADPRLDSFVYAAIRVLEALLLVAEQDGPAMFAPIGVMKALNRHVERVFNSSRKDHHWENRN